MENYASLAEEFYNREKEFLQKNYPGLTLHRLKQELEEYSHGFLDQNEFFKSPFLEGERAPSKSFLSQILKGIPLEYIQGYCYFYKSRFVVSPDVLIPRSETETLVEMGVHFLKRHSHGETPAVLDCGTGSGAIILSLMGDCDFKINGYASDIDPKALKIAKRNYFLNRFSIHQESTLEFKQLDRLKGGFSKLDLIITNPPYIMGKKDRDGVHPQTLKYEPKTALFLDDDYYFTWFEEYFKDALKLLKDNGLFLMEGHENHLDDLKNLAEEVGFKHAQVDRDLTGRDRFLSLKKD